MVPLARTAFTLHCGMRRGPWAAGAHATICRMDILLNGTPRTLAAAATLAALLESEGLAGRRIAVEVNGEIVPRGRHGEHMLHEGDRIEIVHALGGG